MWAEPLQDKCKFRLRVKQLSWIRAHVYILKTKYEEARKFPKTKTTFSQLAIDTIDDHLCVFPIASCAKSK